MTDTHETSIAGLLALARTGDAASLSRLFAICRNYLGIIARAHVESWLQAKADASDLIQQTMLEAYRDFPNFKGATESEWLAWLRRILSSNAADFVRHYRGTDKRQVRREVALRGAGDGSSAAGVFDPPASIETPSQQLVRKERELQIADALAQLSPDHQEVIALRNLQRLPFDEVARRMGRSRPAVQMLWTRAIHKLQEMVHDESSAR